MASPSWLPSTGRDDWNVGGGIVHVLDVTERKRAEGEREGLLQALTRSNAELDQFAYAAGHDLRAPLRGIANLSEWVEQDLAAHMTPDAREKMSLLRSRVHRLESLVDGLLQYARAGRASGSPERVDVRRLVEEVVELLPKPPRDVIDVAGDLPVLLTWIGIGPRPSICTWRATS